MKRMFILFFACFIAQTVFPQEIGRHPTARRGMLYSLFTMPAAPGPETLPGFTHLRWENEGDAISKAAIDSTITIVFSVENIRDGGLIPIEVWEDTDGEMKDLIGTLEGVVKNGKVEIDWNVAFDESNENTNYGAEIKRDGFTILDYIFIAKYKDVTSQKSKLLAVMSWIRQQIIDKDTGEPVRNAEYILFSPDGDLLPGETDDEGWIKQDDLRIIGAYRFMI